MLLPMMFGAHVDHHVHAMYMSCTDHVQIMYSTCTHMYMLVHVMYKQVQRKIVYMPILSLICLKKIHPQTKQGNVLKSLLFDRFYFGRRKPKFLFEIGWTLSQQFGAFDGITMTCYAALHK